MLKSTMERKAKKASAVVDRLSEISANPTLLIGMLDETKLDLLILALGIGSVNLDAEE